MGTNFIFLIFIGLLLQFSSCQDVGCPSEGIAYLPHHDCATFVICLNGVGAEMTCPHSLYYNPETTQCDFPESVYGCRGGTRPPIGTTSTSTQEPSSTPAPPPGALTECGQTLVADNGTIQYKLNEPYDAGELCVFTIRFESGLMNTTFTLEMDGISNSETSPIMLLPMAFREDHIDLGSRVKNVTFPADGAIVIFKTEGSNGTGFRLSFNTEFYSGRAPFVGNDFVFNDDAASPLQPSFFWAVIEYTNLTTFVFTQGAKFITEPDTFIRLRLTVDGNLGNWPDICYNGFIITSFDEYMQYEKSICSSEDVYEGSTRGLFIVQQIQTYPTNATAILTWEKVSNSSVLDGNSKHRNPIVVEF